MRCLTRRERGREEYKRIERTLVELQELFTLLARRTQPILIGLTFTARKLEKQPQRSLSLSLPRCTNPPVGIATEFMQNVKATPCATPTQNALHPYAP